MLQARFNRHTNVKSWESGHRGFTLVELLVVIAIISILAGLLLPVLENALGSARLISCSNNMHQLYVGLIGYTNDNDGNLPIAWWGPGSPANVRLIEWQREVLTYVGDDPANYNCWNQGSVSTWCTPGTAATTVYVANKLFQCPSNGLHTNYAMPTVAGTFTWAGYSSFYWNSYVANFVHFLYPTTTAYGKSANWVAMKGLGDPIDIWKPTKPFGSNRYALLGEGYAGAWMNGGTGYYSAFDGWHTLHNERNNFVLSSGAVVTRFVPYDSTLRSQAFSTEF